ncbi:MAG: penicillin-binding Tp47 domain C-containing protein [Clostridia bacterium]
MQKWNLLKKTAPCILSLAVAATSFPTAVMATDFDTAVVSEAEAQEADVEDFGAEEVEAAEDTTEEMTEDIQQDEAADDLEIQEDAVAEEADPVSDGEDEFSAGDDTEEAFSDESQLKGEYQYVYAGLTWGEYWAAEGVYNAGNTSSSDELDLKGEADKGAFDTVTRATANHGLHRGSYQTEATIIATDGTKFAVSYWKDNQTIVLTDGSEATWNRGFLTKDGKEYEMDHYEVYGLKYVPVAVKTADYADFCKKYNVVNAGETISGGYGEMNLQSYVGLIADVTADTNGLKYAEKNGDSFTFTARKSNGTTSGIKGQALKTATDVEPTVKTADGSYGEFLRVDINGNYGDLGANMQAVRWDYYGDDSTYTTKPLASYGTKFAADNWMHKKMGIQLGLTKSARCKLPGGTDGTGYWKLTVYALGYNDYTYKFQATAENIVEPQVEPTDFTDLKAEVETAKALKQADYTVATWKSFAGELAEAEEVIAKTDASQAEVNEALSHLQVAEKELVKVTAALDKKTAAVYTGKTVTLKATSNDKDAKATFTSSNTKVATVSSTGVVKGVKAGTATITASYGNAKATCKVTVKAPSVKFAKKTATVYKGKTATVKATLAGVSSVKYTSSNKKVATVNSKTGAVKGLKAGTVTITATSGKLKATYKLTVKNPTFSLTKSSATIKKGKTTTIKSKAAPAGKVTYTSSNRKVATVTSKGVVKGIKKGKATITVKCNGITKKFVVTVK